MNNDYTKIALLESKMDNAVDSIDKLTEIIEVSVRERRDSEQSTSKRVRAIIDKVIEWFILLVLAYFMAGIGIQ